MGEQDAQATGGGANDAAAALKAAQAAIAAAQAMQKPAAPAGPAPGSIGGPKLSDAEAEAAMMAQLGMSTADVGTPGAGAAVAAQPTAAAQPTQAVAMPSFSGTPVNRAAEPIDLLGDVNLQVKIELGRTRMLVEDVLRLGEGSVVELDKLAGDPVDVYVNERHVARGEVLVLNDNFCVRISEIISNPEEGRKSA